MTDIEIPYERDRGRRYRFFEALPGLLSWSFLMLPFALSLVNPTITVFFIIAYLLVWFVKAIGMNIRVLQGWKMMQEHQKLNWSHLLDELETGEVSDPHAVRPKWHYANLLRLQVQPPLARPSELFHAIIIATYNESREVLEPTIQAILNSHYDTRKVIFVLAYEERGGPQVEEQARSLIEDFQARFYHAMAVKHPANSPLVPRQPYPEGSDHPQPAPGTPAAAGPYRSGTLRQTPEAPGTASGRSSSPQSRVDGVREVIGKGGNITYAGRVLQTYLETKHIDPAKVVVTTLDSDNRPHPYYLAALSYLYGVSPDPLHVSFQPIPMFTNNIWDAPAPMRVIATGNSFWQIVQALRPHMLRNFSAHAQSMQAIIDTDFWSVRTVVEDGHQFWRSYFRYDGKYEVYPLLLPIYQDAVFAGTFVKTLKAQFIQLRRWAWGASDVAYVLEKGYFQKNDIPKMDMTFKLLRLVEGHVSWATAPLILAFSAFIPLYLNPDNLAANLLPPIASRIQQLAMLGIITTLYLSMRALPPKPARYKRHRTIFMVLQWVYLPITSIVYSSFASLNSQTRLMFGKYLDKFDVTDKAVVTKENETIIGA